jgi:low affinity Fe/Cu permease
MIVYIFLIALIIVVAAILVGSVFGYTKSKSYRRNIYIGAAACAALFALCVFVSGIYNANVSELQAQYNDIMLYNELVEWCDNEQVRFGHYEKIAAFNEEYDRLAETEEGLMFGTLFPKYWSADIDKIDFDFRGMN